MHNARKKQRDRFFEAYDAWKADCLAEFDEGEFGRDHPSQVVEFSEDGDAYPHGVGGVGHIKNAVTPWNKSKHYVPLSFSNPATKREKRK